MNVTAVFAIDKLDYSNFDSISSNLHNNRTLNSLCLVKSENQSLMSSTEITLNYFKSNKIV